MNSVASLPLVDITPTPRILRTLGDIPFQAWQCFAELVDNSLDAFAAAREGGKPLEDPRVDIYWSSDDVPSQKREIIIEDNGPGMDLPTLQNAARAGHTTNGPIHNLGLFGMGLNIATARLGDETLFLSATADAKDWIGVKICFEDLIRDETFSVPPISIPKKHPSEMGTKIIVRRLKEGVFAEIRRKESNIRRQLETIYTPILNGEKVSILLQGKQLTPRPHCVWNESRFTMRKGVPVFAVQQINRDLGETYFDISKNRYLSDAECSDLDVNLSKGASLPEGIVRRSRRLRGWLGIQRYSDTTDFGIDFVRNGRKILVSDKQLFSYENPDTGTLITEYPVDLGSTVGGRIVGELNVDYLIPTYQKNAFDTSDRSWRMTVEAVRGAGPILPRQRIALGYDGENDSPLGRLVNAFRRTDPGTKNLSIPNSIAKEFLRSFRAGDSKYLEDEAWYRVAQEHDRQRSEGGSKGGSLNAGDQASDDIEIYIGGNQAPSGSNATSARHQSSSSQPDSVPPDPSVSEIEQLMQDSEKVEFLSGKYQYDTKPGFEVTAWEVIGRQIKESGVRVPCRLFMDGVSADFFFDTTHPILAEFPISPKQLLLHCLAERFATRDQGVSVVKAYFGLVDNHLSEERINQQRIQERARLVLDLIREKLPTLLGDRFSEVKEVIQEVEAEEEELIHSLFDGANTLVDDYQNATGNASKCLAFVSEGTIKRLIAAFPEAFMDDKLFSLNYSTLSIGSDAMRERLKKNAVDRVISYLSDIILLLRSTRQPSKPELVRNANTISILESLIV